MKFQSKYHFEYNLKHLINAYYTSKISFPIQKRNKCLAEIPLQNSPVVLRLIFGPLAYPTFRAFFLWLVIPGQKAQLRLLRHINTTFAENLDLSFGALQHV